MESLLAQATNQFGATSDETGKWIFCFAGIVGIIVMILTGMNQYKQWSTPPASPVVLPPPLPIENLVTRAELVGIVESTAKAADATATKVDKLEDYTHRRLHDLVQSLQAMALQLANQPNLMRSMIDNAVGPIDTKVDALTINVAAIAAKMGVTRNQHAER